MYSSLPAIRYPLTPSQREIWLDQLQHTAVPLYNVGGYIKIPGAIDPALFEQAVNFLIQKYDVLRTVLIPTENEAEPPLQAFIETYTASVPIQDFSQQNEAESVALAWMQNKFNQPFELLGKPLFRYDLIKVNAHCYYCLNQYHQIIADTQSIALFNQTLAKIYTLLEKKKTFDIKTVSYADFIEHYQAYLDSELFEQNRQYWVYKYLTVPEPLLQPRYRLSEPNQPSHKRSTLVLRPEFQQRIQLFAHLHHTNVLCVWLAALYIYFVRTTQRDDFNVGYTTSNRIQPTFQSVAGLFEQVTPGQFRFGTQLNFSELVQKLHKAIQIDLTHPCPLSEIKTLLNPDTSVTLRLFELYLCERPTPHQQQFNTITAQTHPLFSLGQTHPLSIYLPYSTTDTKLEFIYQQTYFTSADIQALQHHLLTLLQVVLPNDPISIPRRVVSIFNTVLNQTPVPVTPAVQQLSLLTQQETALLKQWNQTKAFYPTNETLVALFEQQVAQTPASTAVVFADKKLTYQQLNEHANQLAYYLLTHPVLKELDSPLIALSVERGLEMVVGLLAILKVGAAYVPIDPTSPPQRIDYILSNSAAPMLLTQRHLKAQLPIGDLVVVCIDVIDLSVQPRKNLDLLLKPDNLACVIYTSDATDKPKGVLLEQRNVVNLVTFQKQHCHIKPDSRVLQFASLGTDTATGEMLASLCNGACLYLAPFNTIQHNLLTVLAQHAITHAMLPPAMLNTLANKTLPALRYLLVTGETCPLKLAQRWGQNRSFINVYGATETAMCASIYKFTATRNSLPIGKPIANTRMYVLDQYAQPLPIGVAGELCIAGDGLARGYLHWSESTEEKSALTGTEAFIHVNLFGQRERIFRTGDLARWRADGNLELLGRIEQQIKLHGFHIEPSEIEAALAVHPDVEHSVVMCTDAEHAKGKHLIAYVVPTQAGMQKDIEQAWVAQQQKIWENTYHQASQESMGLYFNTLDWRNSYTGEALPADEVDAWIDSTVATIQTLNPKQVLELGCGNGLLLARLALHTQTYWGCDFSIVALQQVEQLKRYHAELAHVVLKNRAADDFSNIQPQQFDTVILNAVVHSFPNVDYLIKVLERAIDAVKPGGHVFIGDVRHLTLWRTFHASVQAFQAADDTCQVALRQKVMQQHDTELVIDPRLFIALCQRHPRVSGVKIIPQRGRAHNELTCFHYQAILEIEHAETPQIEIDWCDWQAMHTPQWLLEQLIAQPVLLGLRNVANARLEREHAIVTWLEDEMASAETVGVLQQKLANTQFNGLDPETLWQLGTELGYHVDISWHNVDTQGSFDVLFKRLDTAEVQNVTFPMAEMPFKFWCEYTNNPLQNQLTEKLVPQLHDYLSARLPEHMVPSEFVILAAFPLTLEGRIDYQALSCHHGTEWQ